MRYSFLPRLTWMQGKALHRSGWNGRVAKMGVRCCKVIATFRKKLTRTLIAPFWSTQSRMLLHGFEVATPQGTPRIANR